MAAENCVRHRGQNAPGRQSWTCRTPCTRGPCSRSWRRPERQRGVNSVILDGLLIVGIILNAVKAADLLLRRGQQRGLPDLFERLVRRLDSYRPLEHLTRLASERGQRRLLLMGIAEFLLVVAVDIALELWPDQS